MKKCIKRAHEKLENTLIVNQNEEKSNDSLMILANVAENYSVLSSRTYDEDASNQSSEISKVGFDDTSMDSTEPIDMRVKKRKKKKSLITQSLMKEKKSKKSQNDEDSEEVDDNENDNDNSEPLYCLCNRLSYGNMIECSNEACVFEWFHFACVGLKKRVPKGKWYCPRCRSNHRPTMLKKEYRKGNL